MASALASRVRPQGIHILAHEDARLFRRGPYDGSRRPQQPSLAAIGRFEAISARAARNSDVGRQGRLYAALPDQHAPGVLTAGPGAGRPALWNPGTQITRQESAQGLSDAQQCCEPDAIWNHSTQRPAHQFLLRGGGASFSASSRPISSRRPIANPLRAAGFAGSAAEAAIKMQLHVGAERFSSNVLIE